MNRSAARRFAPRAGRLIGGALETPTPSEDSFAPPPFDAAAALATLKRSLRDLKLAERNGAFELNGRPVVRAQADGAALTLSVVKRPSGSPDWEHAQARDHAMLRKFVDDLKKRLSRWNDARGDD
ncbi:MAG: hypothetical protein ABW032_09090 [Burkholderiaceae bacterium]